MAAFLGLVAFFRPFVLASGRLGAAYAPPLVFGVLLVLVRCVVISEIAEGGINSKVWRCSGSSPR
ncbi:hypothetical protein SCMC78_71570 [Streptomyces sp. CMC78]|uniref:Uncharacterized protein n=1 Tax=Streptomyces sp. CMC78 TaxID=3231512 RepID=A0AB33KS27_9ACTN